MSSHLSPRRPHQGEGDTRKTHPELLNLPLAANIPVAFGSKPVFCRENLGEKVKKVERGRKSLLFHRVPIMQRFSCGHLLYTRSCSPSVGQDWAREAPGSLECRGESTCPSSHWFLVLCMCVVRPLPAAGSCVCLGARATHPSSSSHNVKPGPEAPVREIPAFSCLLSWHLWNSLGFPAWGIHTLFSSSLCCTFCTPKQ